MGCSGDLLDVYRVCTHLDHAARVGTFTNNTQLGRRWLRCSRLHGKNSSHRIQNASFLAHSCWYVILEIDHVVDRRGIDYRGSPQRTRKTWVLLDFCTTKTFPGCRLGRLDPDVYHSRTHENLDLSVPPPHCGHQACGSRHVRSNILHKSLHRSERILVPRRLQTPQSVLGCGCQRSVSVESSGRIRRPCARQ